MSQKLREYVKVTYYEDPHELLGKANYVMANPPFNVEEIDADRVKRDPRLYFGLPGHNKHDKVSNGTPINRQIETLQAINRAAAQAYDLLLPRLMSAEVAA